MPEMIKRGPDEKGKFATQNVDASITIYEVDDHPRVEKEYKLTNLETENTKYGKVDIATATVVPEDSDYYVPEFEDEVYITINDEDIFTGYIGEVTPKENATFEIKCFNDVRKLKTTSVNIGTEEDFVQARKILMNTILPKAGIWNYRVRIDPTNVSIEREQVKTDPPKDVNVKFEESEVSALSIIDRLAKYTNSVWWIDGSGIFHFGNPQTEFYKLSYVKETSAGKTTPPYRSVKVIGGAEASQSSWGMVHIPSKDPIVATRTIENIRLAEEKEKIQEEEGEDAELEKEHQDVYRVKKGETTPPVFTFRDKSIKSGDQADAIANALADKLVQQTRQGWVEIVGWAPVSPFDVIEMPDFLGGARYMVQGVKHTIDSSNGFKTRIKCGGLIYTGSAESVEGAFEG